MSETIISIENVSKHYRLGLIGSNTLREDVSRWWACLRGQPDPTLKVDQSRTGGMTGKDGHIWALRDISMEVRQGEILGIVGRNGAGKSTLLKILSRVTAPTSGEIKVRGRIASLLEVGTGFHPELTGRENIYLNGAILGMTKPEIRRKFDEIVAFAEVQKFIDTPVKRYSSGMYVRLAFAVAAHLEPEILIVDEVLAVGDAEFQRKCLGKMSDVSRSGRTILFVSHNMIAVKSLCQQAVFLRDGQVDMSGPAANVVDRYLAENARMGALTEWAADSAPCCDGLRLRKAMVKNSQGQASAVLRTTESFSVVLEYEVSRPMKGLRLGFLLATAEGVDVCGSADLEHWPQDVREPGLYTSTCTLPAQLLNSGTYTIYFGATLPPHTQALLTTPQCLQFAIEDIEGEGSLTRKLPGIIKPKLAWEVLRR